MEKRQGENQVNSSVTLDYSKSPNAALDRIKNFLVGFVAGFAVLFVFYKIIPLCIVGGVLVGVGNIFMSEKKSVKKRLFKLRTQFYDLLEAMSVSMRAGNPPYKALLSAREDLLLMYSETSDIIVELDLIINRFHNSVPLSESFADFASRSGLEDIESFASVYATIEGKSSRADEIIRETQEIISDKMTIEMEIDTIMTSARSEANIMLFMPLLILLILGYMGGGFMSAIYEPSGRVIATFGLIMFFISYLLTQKFSSVEL